MSANSHPATTPTPALALCPLESPVGNAKQVGDLTPRRDTGYNYPRDNVLGNLQPRDGGQETGPLSFPSLDEVRTPGRGLELQLAGTPRAVKPPARGSGTQPSMKFCLGDCPPQNPRQLFPSRGFQGPASEQYP